MNELDVGLILAFLTALGWAAYYHHTAILHVLKWVSYVMMGVWAIWAIVTATRHFTKVSIIAALGENKALTAGAQSAAIQSVTQVLPDYVEVSYRAIVYFFLGLAYLCMLAALPKILNRKVE